MKAIKWHSIPAVALVLVLVIGLRAEEPPTNLNTDSDPLINIYPDTCGVAVFAPDFVMRNVDDDQELGQQGYEVWDITHLPSFGEDDLKVVTLQATAGKIDATVSLNIISGGEKINHVFWLDAEKNVQFGNLTWSVPAESSIEIILLVEGYTPSLVVDDVIFKASISSPGGIGADGRLYEPCSTEAIDFTTVYEVDMDVDSKNDNDLEAAGFDDTEDQIEFSDDPEKPGKVVFENNGDMDGDGVTDSLDALGLGINAQGQGDGLGGQAIPGLKLVPMQVTLKEPFNTETAYVQFFYEASVPRDVAIDPEGNIVKVQGQCDKPTYVLNKKGIRLWNVDAADRTENVPGNNVSNDGHFIPANEPIPWLDICPEGYSTTIYVEYVDLAGTEKVPSKEEIRIEAYRDEIDAASGLWQSHDDLHVYLVPFKMQDWSDSFSGDDAVGPKYRKIALNGVPMADEKPEQEEETDLPDEETYIDAFNLSLNHSNTFSYVPLGASDLVLQASVSTAETSFSNRSGLRPEERLDLPFGTGWSANLCSYVEVIEVSGEQTDDPITVNVVDEAGRSQRFGTYDGNTYFPWPSSRVDKKTYLNTLTKVGGGFVFQKKFGNTLTFDSDDSVWIQYSVDRVDCSDRVRRHTFHRLVEVEDRYGVKLSYQYPAGVTLIPNQISSPSRPGQQITIISNDGKRVHSITDCRNKTTNFQYVTNAAEYVVPGGAFAATKLTGVTYADGTSTAYTYDTNNEIEVDGSNPDEPKVTYHFHTNVKTITDKRSNTHSFAYEFDQSKFYWSSRESWEIAVELNTLPQAVQDIVEEELQEREVEQNGEWKRMYGLGRKVTSVTLPASIGSSQFSNSGEMYFGPFVNFPDAHSSSATDATGKKTHYRFEDMEAEIIDVDTTPNSISAEWMVYYLTTKILHGGNEGDPDYIGTEIYEFRPEAGLALQKSTDISGNVTTWEFGEARAQPQGFEEDSNTMTEWSDPSAKVDALGRRETYSYGSFRMMSNINDAYGTQTNYGLDAFGNRTSKTVTNGGTLRSESYVYGNAGLKAFMTQSTVNAYASVSGQAWESNLVTSFTPDANGRVQSETTDPGGLSLTSAYTYDSNNNRLTAVDARGNTTTFQYDDLNRLVKVTYPVAGTSNGNAATSKEIWYDFNGNKACEIDEEGNHIIYHYDALNRLIATIVDMDKAGLPSKNAQGLVAEAGKGSATGADLVTTYEYDSISRQIRVTDPRGYVTRTFYDSIRRPVHVFTGLTAAEAAGDLAACSQAAAASPEKTHTEFIYDLTKNTGSSAFNSSGFKPTTIINYGSVLTENGPLDVNTHAVYDSIYRATSTQNQYGAGQFATTQTVYGAIAGQKEALQTIVTDARGKQTKTVMDGLMRPITVTDALGTALASTTQTVYSSTGLTWKSIDPLGRESETEYDAAGRPVVVWQPDPVTGLVNRNNPGNPVLGSPKTESEYDANGNVTATINALGKTWEFEFDARNRKVLERQPAVDKTEIVAGVPQTTPNIQPTITTAYDGVGNVLATTDTRGFTVRNFYDQAYRVIGTIANPVTGNPSADLNAPGANDIITKTLYDENSNPVAVTDGNGNTTQNQYDALNRLIATATNPVSGQPAALTGAPGADDIIVDNAYDDAGNLVQVTDGKDQVTGFRYDGMGRKTQTIWDVGTAVQRIESCTYDGLVKLTREDPLGRDTEYVYDSLHRLTGVIYDAAGGQSNHPDNRAYSYDLVGNILAVTYPNETAARQILRGVLNTYDELNRLVDETSKGLKHEYTYDKVGNTLTTTYGGTNRGLVSAYDAHNRLVTLTESGTEVTSYFYDLAGNITRKTHPNGTSDICTYDALSRKLLTSNLKSDGSLVSSFDYSQSHGGYPSGYDNVGNVLKVIEQYSLSGVKDIEMTNEYDKAYRLITEFRDTGVPDISGITGTRTRYKYDDAHNRIWKETNEGDGIIEISYQYGTTIDGYNSNQLKSVSNGGFLTTFTYDANGNRIGRANFQGAQAFTWDHENRLVQVVNAFGTYQYAYDHRTRRVLRDESQAAGVATELSFSGGLSVQEYTSGSGTPAVEYIRGSDYGGGIGGVLYTIRSSQRSYNSYNSRGDVVSQTDSTESITWQSSYEAFGTRTQEQGVTQDRQKANTKDEDPTGLLNEGMRYRDLEAGVFISRDPLGFVDGPNVYTYVRQNPWTMFDPLGLEGERVDPDGFEWADRNHHKVPRAVARDAGWHPDAKKIFNEAIEKTPNGHNFRAHGKYNNEVAAEMAEFLNKHAPDGLGSKSARQQEKLAKKFVKEIDNTNNLFIKGFNEHVGGGPKGIDKWFNKEGKNIKLKSTGLPAFRRGKVLTGLAKVAEKGGKIIRVPVIGGVIVGTASLAQGKSIDDAGIDVVMSVTGGDIAESAINKITKPAVDAIENRNKVLRELEY